MKPIVFLSFIFLAINTQAQSNNFITNVCGSSYNTSSGKMKISVGEPIVGTHHNTGATISQGFFKSKPVAAVVPGATAFSIFPNPFKDELMLKGDLTKVKLIQLYDVAGRKVLDIRLTGNVLQLKGLNAGIYTARILGENNTILHYIKISKL
jgi:Secretion system C-terminal sorting domain